MATKTNGCCGGNMEKDVCSCTTDSADRDTTPPEKPSGRLVDAKVQLLIAAGAAMAANCEACLNKIVADLRSAGVDEMDIRSAVKTGQFVKERPAEMMKALADRLTGSHLSSGAPLAACPAGQQEP